MMDWYKFWKQMFQFQTADYISGGCYKVRREEGEGELTMLCASSSMMIVPCTLILCIFLVWKKEHNYSEHIYIRS